MRLFSQSHELVALILSNLLLHYFRHAVIVVLSCWPTTVVPYFQIDQCHSSYTSRTCGICGIPEPNTPFVLVNVLARERTVLTVKDLWVSFYLTFVG